jgi:hypothetical protein
MAGFYSHRELIGRWWLGEISTHVENDGRGRRFGTVGQRRWRHGYSVVADLLEKELTGRSHLLVRERKGERRRATVVLLGQGLVGSAHAEGKG